MRLEIKVDDGVVVAIAILTIAAIVLVAAIYSCS